MFQTQQNRHWFTEETFFSLLRLRGIESGAPSGYAEGFFCRKAVLDVTARRLTIESFTRTETRWKQLRFWEGESAAWPSATTSDRDKCVIYEADSHYGGHVYSEEQDGFVWDDGPHVSYTKNEYIQQLFSDLVGGEFEEVQAEVVNYYKGHWIDHPAQSNLYQIPEPLRTQCLNSFLESRVENPAEQAAPANYEEWIHRAFGRVFADTFPAVYTRKYWTREPADLGTDWIGKRVYYPEGRRRDGRRQGSARPLHLLGQSVALSLEGRILHLHPQAGGGRQDRVRQEAGLRQFPETAARIRGRDAGQFRDAGLDPAAAGADCSAPRTRRSTCGRRRRC